MDYIVFIHNNVDAPTQKEQWDAFISASQSSGVFRGGSEIANQQQIGIKPVATITDSIGGFMRFEADDKQTILELLNLHPTVMQGGTVELCEMPIT